MASECYLRAGCQAGFAISDPLGRRERPLPKVDSKKPSRWPRSERSLEIICTAGDGKPRRAQIVLAARMKGGGALRIYKYRTTYQQSRDENFLNALYRRRACEQRA
jgi:hypothetical protein